MELQRITAVMLVLLVAMTVAWSGEVSGYLDSEGAKMSSDVKMSLKDAKAQGVWEMFEQVSGIPRCSKHEGKIIAWLVDLSSLSCLHSARLRIIASLVC